MRRLTRTWEKLGRDDPFWAVLTEQDRRGGKWDPQFFFETGVAEIEEQLAELSRLGQPCRGARALDFGCGVGRITQALVGHYDRVDGVDISASMLEQAKRFNAKGEACRFTENKRSDLSIFDDETFDFIYSRIVLQHMKSSLARRYLREFARVLRPGGVMYFQLPAGWNLDSEKTYEKLRHHVTIPRRIYKIARRIVMLDWFRPTERKRPRVEAEMEMHFTPVAEVVRLLEREKLRLIEVTLDDACGEMIRSYNYLSAKSDQPPARLHGDWAWRKIVRPS